MAEDSKLEELRARIDVIDNQMADLLAERAGVVGHVGEIKGRQAVYIRPGREARMLRALLSRKLNGLPGRLVHRLWREMIGSFTLQEGSLRVAVGSPDAGFWDMARDHFGSFTPMQPCSSPLEALEAVKSGAAGVAALPVPAPGAGAWWRAFLDDGMPSLFYRFPFDGERGNARPGPAGGLIAGFLPPEETGEDETYLVVEWKKESGPPPRPPGARAHVEEGKASWLALEGFYTMDRPELRRWLETHKDLILKARLAGAAPVPFTGTG